MGYHEGLRLSPTELPPQLSAEVYAYSQSLEQPPKHFNIFHLSTGPEFHELEELGMTPAPACTQCAGCKDCTFQRKRLSQEDQEIVARIESSMAIDDLTGTITGRYPWKPCVTRMMSNQAQATKIQSTMERHMVKAGTHGDFVAEMEKVIEEGKVREITDEELESWHDPTHYITTFVVVKLDSVSTKTRVVSNSAMRNTISKLSLNDCMWPGPNALCDLLDCLLFWRAVEVAFMMDLRKAYQAIHTSDLELHLRKVHVQEKASRPL